MVGPSKSLKKAWIFLVNSTLLNTGLLTNTIAQVEETATTNLTVLHDRDAIDSRRRKWEDTLNTDAV